MKENLIKTYKVRGFIFLNVYPKVISHCIYYEITCKIYQTKDFFITSIAISGCDESFANSNELGQ